MTEAALRLLRRGAGLTDSAVPPPSVVGEALASFVGRWSEADEAALLGEYRGLRNGRRDALEMKVLLDTNAYAALFRGYEGIAARVRRSEQVLISVVVAGYPAGRPQPSRLRGAVCAPLGEFTEFLRRERRHVSRIVPDVIGMPVRNFLRENSSRSADAAGMTPASVEQIARASGFGTGGRSTVAFALRSE